jgi:hypothetical protein
MSFAERNWLIRKYHREGYTAPEIQGFLLLTHQHPISLRHLYRTLSSLGLRRQLMQSHPFDILMAVEHELETPAQNYGYRMMRRRLFQDHDVIASCETVRQVLSVMDPEGVTARQNHRWRRRLYSNSGPNYAIHIDGWDKLKPYGLSVHGGIDGFSRRILWLRVCESNKNPAYIADFYLNYLQEINGVPKLVCADLGTENCLVRDIQRVLRDADDDHLSGTASFRYVPSPHNIRIERFWSYLKKAHGIFWINLFQDLSDIIIVDFSNPLHIQCVRFVFTPLIQADLDKFGREWNTHTMRANRYAEVPQGKPNVLFQHPELHGRANHKRNLTMDLDVMRTASGSQSPPELGCMNEFAEIALTIMLDKGYDLPQNYIDAVKLLAKLVEVVDSL